MRSCGRTHTPTYAHVWPHSHTHVRARVAALLTLLTLLLQGEDLLAKAAAVIKSEFIDKVPDGQYNMMALAKV